MFSIIVFFIAAVAFIVLSLNFESLFFFFLGISCLILTIVATVYESDKELEKDISSLTKASGLNVIDIQEDTATIECFSDLPDQKIIFEFKIFDINGVRQLVVNKSDQQLVVLNKDNIDEFYPGFNCLAKV